MAPERSIPEVRPATSADLDAVVGVVWDVAAEGRWLGVEVPFDRGDRRARYAAMLDDPSAAILVADAGSGHGVVGFLDVRTARYGVAEFGMAILDGWRGRGVGSALLDAAIAWAEASGAHKIALEVWPDNTAAIALYRRFGFVEEGRKVRHYRRADGQLWDSVLMGRPLAAVPDR